MKEFRLGDWSEGFQLRRHGGRKQCLPQDRAGRVSCAPGKSSSAGLHRPAGLRSGISPDQCANGTGGHMTDTARPTLIWTEIDFEKNGKQVGVLHLPYSVTRSGYGMIDIPI